jgi:hypothetical protein
MLAACSDTETAQDVEYPGHPNGAFTYNLLQLLGPPVPNPVPNLSSLAVSLDAKLHEFEQTPQAKGDASVVSGGIFQL